MFTPLIFEMRLINDAVFLKVTALFLFAPFPITTAIVPFTLI